MTRNVVRLVVLCVSVAIGASAARALGVSAAVGAAAGAVAAVVAILLEIRAAALPLERLVWGAAGGLLGLGAGLVVGAAAAGLVPAGAGAATRAMAVLLGAYLGAATALARLGDVDVIPGRLAGGRPRGVRQIPATSAGTHRPLAPRRAPGFVDGPLVVPPLL